MSLVIDELKAAEVMTNQVIKVGPQTTLVDAIRLMDDRRVSALPVVDENEVLLGIVSVTDLIGIARELQADLDELARLDDISKHWLITLLAADGENTVVEEVMTEPVVTISPETNLATAAYEMVRTHVHRLPVVDDHGKCLGLLSTTDFIRVFARSKSIQTD